MTREENNNKKKSQMLAWSQMDVLRGSLKNESIMVSVWSSKDCCQVRK